MTTWDDYEESNIEDSEEANMCLMGNSQNDEVVVSYYCPLCEQM